MPSFTRSMQDMLNLGPIAEIEIAVSKAAEDAIRAIGKQTPNSISLTAMIDTGAAITVVKEGFASQLGLQPVGIEYISTASSQNVTSYKYHMRVVFNKNVIVEAPLMGQHVQCLIGRDILAHGVLIYNGYMNQFTLSF